MLAVKLIFAKSKISSFLFPVTSIEIFVLIFSLNNNSVLINSIKIELLLSNFETSYFSKIISKLKSNGLNDKFPLYLTFELLILEFSRLDINHFIFYTILGMNL